MYSDRAFRLSFLISVLIHSVFFFGIPAAPILPSKKAAGDIKIIYYKITQQPSERKKIFKIKEEAVVRKLPEIKEEEILKPPKPSVKKLNTIEKIERPARKLRDISAFEKIEKKRFEKVIEEEQDDERKAAYISYYRAVREKIRQCADENYPRNRNLGQGEVFLSFLVDSKGNLLQVKVIEDKSAQDAILRNIALNSVKEAAPFPSFPKGMSQYQITFNVIISFETKR